MRPLLLVLLCKLSIAGAFSHAVVAQPATTTHRLGMVYGVDVSVRETAALAQSGYSEVHFEARWKSPRGTAHRQTLFRGLTTCYRVARRGKYVVVTVCADRFTDELIETRWTFTGAWATQLRRVAQRSYSPYLGAARKIDRLIRKGQFAAARKRIAASSPPHHDPQAWWEAKILLERHRRARVLSRRGKHVAAAAMIAPSIRAIVANGQLGEQVFSRSGWRVNTVLPADTSQLRRELAAMLRRGGEARLAARLTHR